jgi:nucleoside-diphosphate-sugar epimerase
METFDFIVDREDRILVTGAAGFIGRALVKRLLKAGFINLRCLVRSNRSERLQRIVAEHPQARVELFEGNLLSRDDCRSACQGVAVVYHLAAGRGEKSFPDAYLNSVVTTRNLLEAVALNRSIRRFVNISSFAVYTNQNKPKRNTLDESCPTETRADLRGEAYCFAKLKQDEIVVEYCGRLGIPYVIVRPGAVYGEGNEKITGRVGIDTFGVFLHMGGQNSIPLTYVDNCAEAIMLAGLVSGVDGEVFNVVDDDLPSSREFLRLYKRNVRRFTSVYVPKVFSYGLCAVWERYSAWSKGQLPPAFNRRRWYAFWKSARYSNDKLKQRLNWKPIVSTREGLNRYFRSCRAENQHA